MKDKNQEPINYMMGDNMLKPAKPPKTQGTLRIYEGEILCGQHIRNLKVIIEAGGAAVSSIFEECVIRVRKDGEIDGCIAKGLTDLENENPGQLEGWTILT